MTARRFPVFPVRSRSFGATGNSARVNLTDGETASLSSLFPVFPENGEERESRVAARFGHGPPLSREGRGGFIVYRRAPTFRDPGTSGTSGSTDGRCRSRRGDLFPVSREQGAVAS